MFDKEILPLLRKQNGFHDEITFSVPADTIVTVGSAAVRATFLTARSNSTDPPSSQDLKQGEVNSGSNRADWAATQIEICWM
jgi:hypothetical protein